MEGSEGLSGFWGVAVIIGPIVLLALIVWAYLRNKGASARTHERAERGAADLREEIERGDPPPHA